MFGLMRPEKSCSTHRAQNSDYYFHRMHYCGTCKAMGNQFGQSSRMLLNFDIVFLSEILSLLDKEDTTSWESNLTKVNTCFSMPKEGLPFSLQYAATANMLLSELKFDDNIKDSKRISWRIANEYFSSSFKKAKAKFKHWGISTDSIQEWIIEQANREQNPIKHNSLIEGLQYYAEATAHITGTIFLEGANKTQSKVDLYQLGYAFGELMYILDAFEDFEKDVFKGEFNPLAILLNTDRTLTNGQLESVRTVILSLQEQLNLQFDTLPISDAHQERYKSRLMSNLALRIYQERVIPQTFTERIKLRWQNAKDFADQITCQPQTWVRQINYYAIVLAVFISPDSSAYLPQDGKAEMIQWTAIITASLAGLGLAGVIRRKSKKEKREEKKEKRKKERFSKRLVRKLKRILSRKGQSSCCGNCAGACCQGCCDVCCDECCQSCCDGCCDSCSTCEDEDVLIWLIIILCLIAIAAITIGILVLLGIL